MRHVVQPGTHSAIKPMAFGVIALLGLAAAALDSRPSFAQEARMARGATAPAVHGQWQIHTYGDRTCLRLRFDLSSGGTINTDFDHDNRGDTVALAMRGGPFQVQRDAGTFHFENRSSGPQSAGTVTFEGHLGYLDAMLDIGFDLERDALLPLAIHDLPLEVAHELAALGYDGLSRQRLVAFVVHDVTPQFIRDFQAVGLESVSPQKLVAFAVHDVTADDVRAFHALGLEPTPGKLVSFAVHDVRPGDLETFQQLGLRLSPEKLIAFAVHDVTVDDVRAFHALDLEPTPEKLIAFAVHDVTPALVEELGDLGYRGLTPEQLVRMQIHDVTPRFIRKLQQGGRSGLDVADMVHMRIHGEDD